MDTQSKTVARTFWTIISKRVQQVYNGVPQLLCHHTPRPQSAKRYNQVLFREAFFGRRTFHHTTVNNCKCPVQCAKNGTLKFK